MRSYLLEIVNLKSKKFRRLYLELVIFGARSVKQTQICDNSSDSGSSTTENLGRNNICPDRSKTATPEERAESRIQ